MSEVIVPELHSERSWPIVYGPFSASPTLKKNICVCFGGVAGGVVVRLGSWVGDPQLGHSKTLPALLGSYSMPHPQRAQKHCSAAGAPGYLGGVDGGEAGGGFATLWPLARTKRVVSNPQCGHATTCPALVASNSMCPLQYWQEHFTNRGAEGLIGFRVLAPPEGVKPGTVENRSAKFSGGVWPVLPLSSWLALLPASFPAAYPAPRLARPAPCDRSGVSSYGGGCSRLAVGHRNARYRGLTGAPARDGVALSRLGVRP